jgi:4-amino-4-deoxy-L-arabinose transferase-like glycosyltransferase
MKDADDFLYLNFTIIEDDMRHDLDTGLLRGWRLPALIALLAALSFFPFLGSVHLFEWDECNFAECSREMIVTGDYLRVHVDYRPFWEKPPLFFWMQAASMKVFGVNEYAARFPNAVAGVVASVVLFLVGAKLFDRRFGVLWALVYAGSLLPHFYFRSGIIDPWFNLFMLLGVVFLFRRYAEPERRYAWLLAAGGVVGLATLTKGPVGFLLPSLAWFVVALVRKYQFKAWILDAVVYSAASLVAASLWFGVETIQNGFWFVETFVHYQIRLLTTGDAGHSQPFYYHFLVVLVGCFPASTLVFVALKKNAADDANQRDFKLWMVVLLAVVLVVFTVVKTKIVHYSSLTYYPVAFLAAYALRRLLAGELRWRGWNTWLIPAIGVWFGLILLALPIIGLHAEEIMPYVKDRFARANLQADAGWTGWEALIGGAFVGIVVVGTILAAKRRVLAAYVLLFGSTIALLNLTLPVLLPKVERYTQGATIDFYKEMRGKEAYIYPLGFKSYGYLFYSKKPPELSPGAVGVPEEDWKEYLLYGEIERPAYFVMRNTHADKYDTLDELTTFREKNGWVIMRRAPAAP